MKSFQQSFLSLHKMVRSRGDFQSAKSWMMDLFAISVVASVIIFFSWGAGNLDIPASDLTYQKITLEMSNITSV